MVEFEWDPTNAESNRQHHGVSFSEAKSVFYDEYAPQFFDEDNFPEEDRFIMPGMSDRSRVPTVAHCISSERDSIRII